MSRWSIVLDALSKRDVGFDVSAILNPRFRSLLFENVSRTSGIGAGTAVAICLITNDGAIVDAEQHLIFSRPVTSLRRNPALFATQSRNMSLDPHLRWVEESRGVASPTRGSSRSGRLNEFGGQNRKASGV